MNYVDLNLIYPDLKILENFIIFKEKIKNDESNLLSDFYSKNITTKECVILANKKGEVIMSNHKEELMSNEYFIKNATGDVLIFGIGLGLIIFPLLNKKEIKSITIVEKEKELIDYVGSKINEKDKRELVKIIHSDAFDFIYECDNEKYDFIYFDIWNSLNDIAYNEMEILHRMYVNLKKDENSKIDSWGFDLKKLIIQD